MEDRRFILILFYYLVTVFGSTRKYLASNIIFISFKLSWNEVIYIITKIDIEFLSFY